MIIIQRAILILFSCLILAACQQTGTKPVDHIFELMPPEKTGVQFINQLKESAGQNVLTYEYYYNGAGLAIADFNGDTYPDLFFVSNLDANQFYLNQQDFSFEEVTAQSQLAGQRGFYTGATTVDINADGLMDIYVCKSGRFSNPDLRRNELYINTGNDKNGIPVFKESAKTYSLDIPAYSNQAAFFDYDRDGDLDMFLINHDIDTYATEDIAQLKDQAGGLAGEMLFRNDHQHFTEVTKETGIINNKLGFGLGVAIGDLNNDHWPDVYVSNDYSGKDHLYINQQDGTFTERVNELTPHISFNAMGNDIGDINNDGWQDIVNLDMVAADNYGIKTSMSAMNPAQFEELVRLGQHRQYMFNTLLLNNGSVDEQAPYFSDIGQFAGISNTDWSWAPLLFDMNNDGHQDLFISNGIKRNIRNNDAVKAVEKINTAMMQSATAENKGVYFQQMLKQFPYHPKPNYFYLNRGDLSFQNITGQAGADSLLTASNGAAYSDLDLDGDLDLVINNVGIPATLLRNNSGNGTQHYLQIELEGSAQNPTGIGARVYLKYDDKLQSKELYTSRGYLSAVEPVLHFGLGKTKLIEQLEVHWPDGKSQTLKAVKADQRITLAYKNVENNTPLAQPQQAIFTDISSQFIQHKHRENPYDDFKRESLLPHKMSNMGPALAVGDVNGDGLEDMYIGGAKGFSASLYVQQKDGKMTPSDVALWQKESYAEDVAAVFLDADNDGDLDLIVGSGSNEEPAGDAAYQIRFYENKNGNFTKHSKALPPIRESIALIATADFDGDGDEDIFLGGRQVPRHYPSPANSYLLRNDSKDSQIQFTDVTANLAPFLKELGMVTDALWADINKDKRPDLITVGEWMSPRIFINQADGFTDYTTASNLDKQTGWWYSIAAADFDQDGDIDLVAGNLGLNYKYKASPETPFEIYANDFDENGSADIVLGYHDSGNLFPLRGRECSSAQMPFIKTKFPTYEAFGQATLQEIYPSAKLNQAVTYSANNFASSYFENDGQGRFEVRPLPVAAQLSSINDILIQDFNQDGHKDILVAGNLYEAEVETPRNDASIGLLLKGDGKGNFSAVPAHRSGVQIVGEVRCMLSFSWGSLSSPAVLIGRNDGDLQLIKIK